MDKKEEILRLFPGKLREILGQVPGNFEDIQEIRLRAGRPLLLVKGNEEFFLSLSGKPVTAIDRAVSIQASQIRETVEYMGSYSLYAFEEEVRRGFLTLQGGHRVGLAGQAVLESRPGAGYGQIKTLKYISFLNVRIAHEKKGCASKLLPLLQDSGKIQSTLFISPPRCGKTTILRDLIRLVSDGGPSFSGMTVGVVDERSELGACCQGIPQNDLGMRTDVLDCCPKADGMMMLIKTMAPQVVAVDEIGSEEDFRAIEYARSCGCRLLATVHGDSIEDLKEKPILKRLVEEKTFSRYVVLGNLPLPGTVLQVYGRDQSLLYGNPAEKRTEKRPAGRISL